MAPLSAFKLRKVCGGKTCLTGRATVATIEGRHQISTAPQTDAPWLLMGFHQICDELRKGHFSVNDQVAMIINELKIRVDERLPRPDFPQDLDLFGSSKLNPIEDFQNASSILEQLDRKFLDHHFRKSFHVNYVSVVAYENGTPSIAVKELLLEPNDIGQWKTTVRQAPELHASRCSPKFHGANSEADRLLKEMSSTCPASSPHEAMELFTNAACETNARRSPNVKGGYVGGDLHIWEIPIEGDAKFIRLLEADVLASSTCRRTTSPP